MSPHNPSPTCADAVLFKHKLRAKLPANCKLSIAVSDQAEHVIRLHLHDIYSFRTITDYSDAGVETMVRAFEPQIKIAMANCAPKNVIPFNPSGITRSARGDRGWFSD